MYLHVGRGQNCWVVHLANEDRKDNWVVLKAFQRYDNALAFALAMKELQIIVQSDTEFETRLQQAIEEG